MPGVAAVEGVTKFQALHASAPLPALPLDVLEPLLEWRARLFERGLIGQDPARYGGAGFCNVSARLDLAARPAGRRTFIVTGTQTGGVPTLDTAHISLVTSWSAARNTVSSRGLVAPSSEAMTHGAVYDADSSARVVLHVHDPLTFRHHRALRLPTVAARIDYGTPAMAQAVEKLMTSSPLRRLRVFVMAGHEDGVVAYGTTAQAAGDALLFWRDRARAMDGGVPSRAR